MKYFITIEWDDRSKIKGEIVMSFLNKIEPLIQKTDYGTSISKIVVVVTCMEREFVARKKFKKSSGRLEYDILLDYYLLKNVSYEEKKTLLCYQIIKVTNDVLNSYKFDDFNTAAFLKDFTLIMNSITWEDANV